MKKLLNWGISLKIFCLLALLMLVLSLIPVLNAARYDVPSADDYSYGISTHQAWIQTGSVKAVLKAAADKVLRTYQTWQGSFSAIFLFTLNPMIFDEFLYSIGPWIMIMTLLLGIFSLFFSLWRKMFGAHRTEALIIAAVYSILCIQFLPRASQGFFWFNGAVYYTFFFGLSLTAYALILRFILRGSGDRGIGKLICISLLLFFIGGGNLVTGLTSAVLLITMEVLLILMRHKDWKVLLIPVICFFAAFIINVSAPGNAVRQKYYTQPGLFQAVILSFKNAGIFFAEWFSLPVIALILLLIPILWKAAARSGMSFRFPGLVSLYSVCLTGVMLFPPIYAMTDYHLSLVGRITNIIFFGMVFLAIFNLYYWMGWLIRRGIIQEKIFPAAANGRFSMVYLLVIALIFCFGMTQIKWYDTTSISAFQSYRSGQMGNYFNNYKHRLEVLKDPEVKDAVLKRYPYRPYVLFYMELSESKSGNEPIEHWYGKNSVIVQ